MRLFELTQIAKRHHLDEVLISDVANVKAITGINCDNAVLTLTAFYTDFRYVPMVHRVAPDLKVRDIRRLRGKFKRIGYESTISHARYLKLAKQFKGAEFVDISSDLKALRAVKTEGEIAALKSAEALNCRIWKECSAKFKPGMTEREMATMIKTRMIELGDGEAFDTIVCVGKNAAECHHEPDETIWDGKEGLLVDMGVKLGGFCSDLTRNLKPKRQSALYKKVYATVEAANRQAIAAARSGMTAAKLDKVARDVITKAGFGKCFGHSTGHGVGYEIHEAPSISKRDKTILKPGMIVTIEPGIYLEGNLGVRIEDMILITKDGCEVLSERKEKC